MQYESGANEKMKQRSRFPVNTKLGKCVDCRYLIALHQHDRDILCSWSVFVFIALFPVST